MTGQRLYPSPLLERSRADDEPRWLFLPGDVRRPRTARAHNGDEWPVFYEGEPFNPRRAKADT